MNTTITGCLLKLYNRPGKWPVHVYLANIIMQTCRWLLSSNIMHVKLAYSCADKGKDIELRHQRNPDVTFDTVRVADGEHLTLPQNLYHCLLQSGELRHHYCL